MQPLQNLLAAEAFVDITQYHNRREFYREIFHRAVDKRVDSMLCLQCPTMLLPLRKAQPHTCPLVLPGKSQIFECPQTTDAHLRDFFLSVYSQNFLPGNKCQE